MQRRDHVLYLDFDGVLHPEGVYWHPKRGAHLRDHDERAGHRLFEHVDLLDDLLAPYPELGIVLSTSWAVHYRFAKARQRLSEGLQRRCIGATFHSEMDRSSFVRLPRGLQVKMDVVRRQPLRWLAIDDTDEGWESAREHVVLTDSQHGIAEPLIRERLTQALRRFATA